MSREAHVQFCERLGVRFPGATLPGITIITDNFSALVEPARVLAEVAVELLV
jgi:hypothetical protein